MHAANTNVFTYSVYESVVIDKLNINGLTGFGVEIKNNSISGNVTNVSTYGSPNGIDYYPIENNLFQTNIGPGELKHVEFGLITGFLRITVQTDADINIDIYVHGIIS